jgi:hypothetical protein
MSFQAYIDNIKDKTGKTPADFKKLAEKKEFIIVTDMQWQFMQHSKEKRNNK